MKFFARYSLVILLGLLACQAPQRHTFHGQTMGTTYTIHYIGGEGHIQQAAIDTLLAAVNQSVSTYIPDSIISRLNRAPLNEPIAADSHFVRILQRATELFHISDGAFDPSLGPLINAWGFGFEHAQTMTPEKVDSLLQYLALEQVEMRSTPDGPLLVRHPPGPILDFSAIAKGYGVDVVAELLEKNNIHRYMVEIGGEVRARGHTEHDDPWHLAIEEPTETDRRIYATVGLENQAMATSGNYRNFYLKEGQKFAHILNPETGYPAETNLLSATVFAPDCITADAMATAFMVMGLEKAMRYAKQHQLGYYFITADANGQYRTHHSPDLPLLTSP